MKHRIAMNLEVENAPEAILADEIKMKQILYNLLSNAFKFTPDAGRISLRAWQVNGDDASRPEVWKFTARIRKQPPGPSRSATAASVSHPKIWSYLRSL